MLPHLKMSTMKKILTVDIARLRIKSFLVRCASLSFCDWSKFHQLFLYDRAAISRGYCFYMGPYSFLFVTAALCFTIIRLSISLSVFWSVCLSVCRSVPNQKCYAVVSVVMLLLRLSEHSVCIFSCDVRL